MGQFIQTGITRGFIERSDKWAYKIPYAIQWVWPIIIIPGLFFAPESPWWLIRQNRMEDAERSLARLSEKHEKVDTTNTLAMMVKTGKIAVLSHPKNFGGAGWLNCCFDAVFAGSADFTVYLDLYEREVEVGSSYLDCWKGPNRRRMEICIMLFVIQNFSGNPVGFATYLFEQVGLSPIHAFDMGLG
jgi:MFS transporter, SP family, general alpha glucoside:H+ symporter